MASTEDEMVDYKNIKVSRIEKLSLEDREMIGNIALAIILVMVVIIGLFTSGNPEDVRDAMPGEAVLIAIAVVIAVGVSLWKKRNR